MKYLALILALTLLGACGEQTDQTAQTTVPLPAGPVQPQIQPSPSLPTANPNNLVFENIPQLNYTHPSLLFSVNYPDNWQVFEQVNGVIFIDPTVQGAYSVQVSQTEEEIPAEALGRFTEQFIYTNFGEETGFEIIPSQTAETINFKSIDANFGPSINQAATISVGTTVFITLATVAEEKWAASSEGLYALLNTLQINREQVELAAAPGTPTPEAPPIWNLFSHSAQNVAFLYPSNWVITETEQSVTAAWPEYRYNFTVEIVPSPGVGENPSQVERFIQEQTDALAAEYDAFEMLPLAPYTIGEITGYTSDYLYTDTKNNEQIAASIITVGIDDNIYKITISAPAPGYEVALNWFNPIMQSFQILKAE